LRNKSIPINYDLNVIHHPLFSDLLKTMMMDNISKEVHDGQSIYTKFVLSVYDVWVLKISNTWIWKCPSRKILQYFNDHISSNHLDVGVGTGYFIDRCKFPEDEIRFAIMDLNPNSLDMAEKRLRRYHPIRYRGNILDPIRFRIEPFDSISINYLFHCLPGSFYEKSKVLDHLYPLLKKGGKVFGSTILQGNVKRNLVARRLMKIYNSKGIFSNTKDTLESLEQSLRDRFESYHIRTEGCVGLFCAIK